MVSEMVALKAVDWAVHWVGVTAEKLVAYLVVMSAYLRVVS